MVSGASLEPSIGTPSRFNLARMICSGAGCPCTGPRACCFSSSWRIWRSSLKMSLACCWVMPLFCCCAASGSSIASERAAVFAYLRFFMEFLLLLQHQQVLDVLDVFPLHQKMEIVGLEFFDHIRHIEPDMGHGSPVRHRFGPLIIFYDDQLAIRLERLVNGRQHLLGKVEMVVDVE